MLVLTRKKEEAIVIGEDIEIVIVDVGEDRVRIGINAPRELKVFRKELLEAVKEENKNSGQAASDILAASKLLKK